MSIKITINDQEVRNPLARLLLSIVALLASLALIALLMFLLLPLMWFFGLFLLLLLLTIPMLAARVLQHFNATDRHKPLPPPEQKR